MAGMTSSQLTGAIQLPDDSWVRGRGLRNPTPAGASPHYGLYLGTQKMRARHDPELTWPHEWIEWPDFRLPRDDDKAIAQIRALHELARAGQQVEAACGGGVGRTGTVVACLAILAGVPSTEAVAWARANYHRRAVETPWQRTWVTRFPDH
jgi:hypothetical protein